MYGHLKCIYLCTCELLHLDIYILTVYTCMLKKDWLLMCICTHILRLEQPSDPEPSAEPRWAQAGFAQTCSPTGVPTTFTASLRTLHHRLLSLPTACPLKIQENTVSLQTRVRSAANVIQLHTTLLLDQGATSTNTVLLPAPCHTRWSRITLTAVALIRIKHRRMQQTGTVTL